MCVPTAKGRAIAIPVDLDNQVNNLFVKSNNIVQKTAMSWRLSARNATRRDSVVTASRDYRNIIERLQVQYACVCMCVCASCTIITFMQALSVFLHLRSRTLCRLWRTVCVRWSRLSCLFWWTCFTGLSCSSPKTQTRARSVRAGVSYASKGYKYTYPWLYVNVPEMRPNELMCLRRLIKHTKQLLEENEERLCIKVLQTLREMMTKDRGYGEKVGGAAECRMIHSSDLCMLFFF